MKRPEKGSVDTNMRKILVICGPTATGKSDLAVALARKFNGEIISADSRQVYRGMDMGSGKVTSREMKKVPHHLLDVADPRKRRYTVEGFKKDATAAITNIVSRGKLPIICGGTGFYIDTLVFDTHFPEVPPDQALRKRLEKKSVKLLMKEITRLDPRRAKTLDPFNKVRIIRAIEIARALGSVPKLPAINGSSIQSAQRSKYDTLFIGLKLDKDSLREKIHKRLIKRIKAGMILEVAKLKASGVSWKRLQDFGLEYRYVALYLQKKISSDEMLSKLESEIVKFAKRQMQWFGRNQAIKWFEPGKKGATLVEKLVDNFI